MAQIRPLTAIRYAQAAGLDLSALIAPPYDVLDEHGKAALQAKHPANIVTVDLPHLPPKTVGPDAVYRRADATFQSWLQSGILRRDLSPGLYPYRQTYQHDGKSFTRQGFFGLVRLSPFGAGQVVPHEKTYANPIEDRLKLMRATGLQLSPIFGLYDDPDAAVAGRLCQGLSMLEGVGTLEGVRNELWRVDDPQAIADVSRMMAERPVYIADGHHRYTTALQFQEEMRQQAGGALPEEHPANWCLFVLVAMQDPGLLIHPTHRLIGGLTGFDAAAFKGAVKDRFDMAEVPLRTEHVDSFVRDILPKEPPHTFGLFDAAAGKVHLLRLKDIDVLKPLEPAKSEAWRRLDVAILQRYLIEEVIQPKFAGGAEVAKGYTAKPEEVAAMADGQRYQIALLLQSTPLSALIELGKHGEIMPQKSTYFYPKLATGMVINSLR